MAKGEEEDSDDSKKLLQELKKEFAEARLEWERDVKDAHHQTRELAGLLAELREEDKEHQREIQELKEAASGAEAQLIKRIETLEHVNKRLRAIQSDQLLELSRDVPALREKAVRVEQE